MSNPQNLINKRGVVKAQLTRQQTYINSLSGTITSEIREQLNIREKKLEQLWGQFESVQSAIEGLENQTEDQNLEREHFETDYFNILSKLKFLQKRDLLSKTENQNAANEQANGINGIKLPTIKLPTFDGKFSNWIEFRDSFEGLINQNTLLTKTQKLFYLKSSLKDEAATTIQDLQISENNYDIAWSLLKTRFENKQAIINQHINLIMDIPVIHKESLSSLRNLYDVSLKNIKSLNSIHEPTKHWDLILIHILANKLDPITRKEWEKESQQLDMANMDIFQKFILNKCMVLENLTPSTYVKPDIKQGNKTFSKFSKSNVQHSYVVTDVKCLFCSNAHYLYQCPSFSQISVDDRWNEVKKIGVCFNCLREKHTTRDCKFGHCKYCNGKHNSILHRNKVTNNTRDTNVNEESTSSAQGVFISHAAVRKIQQTILSTAIIFIYDASGNKHRCRALLDSGSQSSLITKDLVDKLKLPVRREHSVLIGINQLPLELNLTADVKIASMYSQFQKILSCIITPVITGALPALSVDRDALEIPRKLYLADANFCKGGSVDLLIGADLFWEILRQGQINTSRHLKLLETDFGWVIGGTFMTNGLIPHVNNFVGHCNKELDTKLERFWIIEEITGNKTLSTDDTYCEEYFSNTVTRDNTGRYTVKIPFNNRVSELGNSRNLALDRFYKLEKRFKSNEQFKSKYVNFMREYEDMGHMTVLSESVNDATNDGYFIPHHGIFKKNVSDSKIRVVFDGSAKTDSGLSLNDVQYVGPALLNDIFSILLNFRMHHYAMTADITKMYRMINIALEQRKYQKIFWRSDISEPLRIYQLNTVTYGTASAAFLAIRTLHQLAMECGDAEIAEIILRALFMDDLLYSAKTKAELIKIRTKLISIFKSAGFILDKWRSNIKDNISEITDTILVKETEGKVLGIFWDSAKDTLQYSFRYNTQKTISKRTILSIIAQFFDPLGILTPILIFGKLIIQNLWRAKITWDEPVPNHIQNDWIQYQTQLEIVNLIKIPRSISVKDPVIIELHGFADSSEKAYGACLYVRSINGVGECQTNLLCSKSKVAPLKTLTIPRLELCAALLLAKLYDYVCAAVSIKFHGSYFWSDSKIVLSWINSEPCKWKIFIANRVTEIQSLTRTEDWRYVNTRENPADLISRGVNSNKSFPNDFWFHGPHWLRQKENNWPINFSKDPEESSLPELKRVKLINVVTQSSKFDLFNKYSTCRKLKRIFAYVLRFINNLRARKQNQSKHLSSELTAEEVQRSLDTLIKIAQAEDLSSEIQLISDGKKLENRHKLISLNPFMDHSGILRVGGRLRRSEYTYEKIHPAILPAKHILTQLIAKEEHARLLHAGPQLLLASLREKYWLINGRNICRKLVKKCITCFRTKPRNFTPIMGNLPKERLTATFPFFNVGIDYAGPFLIKDRKLRGAKLIKCYVCLFVCLATKAVHFELAIDLSTETFLSALRRFIARRGRPKAIYSDNGTNFVGAYAEIKKVIEFLKNSENKFQQFLSNENITWKFNPPHAPNFGGLWEAAVKSMKTHLHRIVGNLHLHYEELLTILVQIEGILNSRPLCSLSSDPSDLKSLTPAHFIIGRPITALPEMDYTDHKEGYLKRYQLIQQSVQHFWHRWCKEYIGQLQQRSKWRINPSGKVQVGDLVLMHEDGNPPYRWPLGRITELHPGVDGIIRVASVKCRSSTLKRPITKLFPLPTDASSIEDTAVTALQGRGGC